MAICFASLCCNYFLFLFPVVKLSNKLFSQIALKSFVRCRLESENLITKLIKVMFLVKVGGLQVKIQNIEFLDIDIHWGCLEAFQTCLLVLS